MGETRQARKERISTERRRQVLDAALAVFSRKGFDRATIPEIAEEAGAAVGTIYNYFRSKRHLLISVIEDYLVTESPAALSRSLEGEDFEQAVYEIVHHRVTVGLRNPDALWLLMLEVQRDPELRELYVERVLRPGFEPFLEQLQRGMREGALREFDTALGVRAMLAMVIGIIALYRLEGEDGPLRRTPPEAVAAEVAKLVVRAIRKE